MRPDLLALWKWLERPRAAAGHPHLPGLASAVLVVIFGWQLAGLTWALAPEPPSAEIAAGVAADAGGEPSTPEADPSARLARLELFGAPEADGGDGRAADAAPADAPETQLDLTLAGVYAPRGDAGLAIVSAGGGPEKVFAVGDTIGGNARVVAVYADRIVLRRSGRAETLRLEGAEDAPPTAAARPSRDAEEIAAKARELRQRLRDEPLGLARMVRFQPHTEDGRLIGFRVEPREADAGLLADLGLRPSDVVTRVNGIDLDDPAKGRQALEALRDARRIDVTLLRNGRRVQRSIPIGGGS